MKDPVTPLTPEQEAEAIKEAQREGYAMRLLVGADQMGNVLTGGLPGETISARMGRWTDDRNRVKRGVGRLMCTWLGWLQPNHDAYAQAGDEGRAAAVILAEKASKHVPN